MHSPSVESRNPHGKCAADGYRAIARLYPPGSRSVTQLFFAGGCLGMSRTERPSAEQWCQRRYGRKHQIMIYFIKSSAKNVKFFNMFFGWLLHGSTSPLSGRSPFCQLQLGEKCRKNIGFLVKVKNVNEKTPTTLQSPRECRKRV